MNRPIVVGSDGSPSAERAVRWAAVEASRRRRRLHIVCAVPRRDPASAPYERGTGAGRVLDRASALAAEAAEGLTITTEPVYGPAGHALYERAGDADEVVVGHRGLGGLAGLVLGSTSMFLADRAPCPLVVVRDGDGGDEVLVGTDLERGSSGVLKYAFEAAALRGAWLRAVHTWEEPPEPLTGTCSVAVRAALGRAQERLSDAMAHWRAAYPEVRVIEETPCGRTVDELLRRSSRAGLIVVGARRRGGCGHLGSVAHGVIHHAPCPVAVVPAGAAGEGESTLIHAVRWDECCDLGRRSSRQPGTTR
jgi:nucleotide-binding universal stress UspA family protein